MVRTPTKWTFTRVLGVLSFGVDTLVKVAGLTVANTSQHLQQLRQAGLVTSRKEGLTEDRTPIIFSLFEELLKTGISPAKGLGCGMLSLAPA